jgi:hypothetical protein
MMHRQVTAAAIVVVAVVMGAAQLTRSAAQPQSLAGSSLRPIDDGDALIGGIIEMLAGRNTGDSRPSIERVVVVEDDARRLVVAVTYSGLNNLRLAGETRGRDRRRQPFIVAQPVSLVSAAGDATIAFELQGGVPEGTRIESASLRLVAFDPARPSIPVLSRTFALPKQWAVAPSPSNVVITVAPRGVGTAARLGSRPDYAQPPKILVPIRGTAVTTQPGTVIRRDHRDRATGTATRPTGGTVRDHRDGAATGTATRPTGGTVRDHRDGAATGTATRPTGGTVRDHRGGAATGTATRPTGGTERDHRDGAETGTTARPTAGEARDHRDTQSGNVRDHRTRERQQVAQRTRRAAETLSPNAKMVMVDRFRYGIKPEDAQQGAQGPAASAVELLEGLRTEDIDLDPASLLSIATSIYPDKNATSGIFYYHPRSYHLEWTPESGYGMRILYGAAAGDGAAGDVLMAARLKSGLDLSEVQLATQLLTAYTRRNGLGQFKGLRPLPLEKDGTDVSFGSVLGQYSIPKDKIAVTALSDVLGEIEVSWITDPVTKENLQLALVEDVGVSGEVSFTPTGKALAPQVPISIQLGDRDSFGRLRWNRDEGPRNVTPYPLRLRYLHALCIDPNTNAPILYTWSLGDSDVPPMARVRWDASRVPAWIDTEAKRIWVDYEVARNCDACDKQVLDAITGGVTSVTAEQITFHTITPLADVGGYEITAQVRSRYFDPKDRTVVERAVVLKADNQDVTLRPIYSAGRRDGEPLFEYRLDLAMPDGTVHRGASWITSDTLRVLVGRAQLEQSLGMLPAKVQVP